MSTFEYQNGVLSKASTPFGEFRRQADGSYVNAATKEVVAGLNARDNGDVAFTDAKKMAVTMDASGGKTVTDMTASQLK
ncbi:hypothetical protein ABTE39_19950, partial [Acinetobacter baumannii]